MEQESILGSSPHTRGARALVWCISPRCRIIPAYAGSTTRVVGAEHAVEDHPRIRGEHARGFPYAFWRLGSSPHTRGAQGQGRVARGRGRIIPAYAGSTNRRHEAAATDEDHPRIRGEHRPGRGHGAGGDGSSPHTRGARVRQVDIDGAVEDHPRIRGEHLPLDFDALAETGSSPHTRGALQFRGPFPLAVRIIPAYAGSTPTPTWSKSPYWDHPRIRGEHEP